jgi:hypothetical protein
VSRLLELNLNPEPRVLRQFGFIALVGFGLLALAAHYEILPFSMGLGAARAPLVVGFTGIAVVSATFSLVAPRLNRLVYIAISVLTYPIGLVLSYVILGFLFFAIIAPIGVLLRALGKDPMQRRFDESAVTYFTRVKQPSSTENYFHQY